MDAQLALPSDLVAFLSSGTRLQYPSEQCEAGAVELYPVAELRLRTFDACCSGFPEGEQDPGVGCYRVPAVDLIKTCTGDYEPEGLLIWLPGEQQYGVCDTSHDLIFVFPAEVTWSVIVRSAHRFINAQWAFDDLDKAEAKLLVPWPKYPCGN